MWCYYSSLRCYINIRSAHRKQPNRSFSLSCGANQRKFSTKRIPIPDNTKETQQNNMQTIPPPSPAPSPALPMVLLPGMMLDHALWQRMLPQLSTLGPLVYADLSQDDSIESMALRTLSQAPARFTLVGFSMGGFVARTIMRMAPERVANLILIATSVRPDSPSTLNFKQYTAKGLKLNPGSFKGLGRKAIAASLSPKNENDETLHQIILEMSMRMGEESYCHQLLLTRPDDSKRLEEYKCPTLVIAARQDKLRTIEESEEMVAAIPGAQLTVVEDSGHMIPLEQPGTLLQIMREWLKAKGGLS